MGVLRPIPHVGGAQTANRPAPPGDWPVRVKLETEATRGLLLRIDTGALAVVTLFSSSMSAWTVLVSVTLSVTDVVVIPAGSPLRCNLISTGRQVLKKAAGEDTVPTLAITPVSPGVVAVTTPLASIEPTPPVDSNQLKGPTREVMSVAL